MAEKEEAKIQKKLAKAEVKAAKGGGSPLGQAVSGQPTVAGMTPAERSAEAAEKQLQLHRWKVAFGAISALIALVSLIVLLLRS